MFFLVKVLILILVFFFLRMCVIELCGCKICFEGFGIFGSGVFFIGLVNSINVSIFCDIFLGEVSKFLFIFCIVYCFVMVCGME